MASVSLSSVGLTYPDGTVGLENIDLEIADGEFVALVGPSGSGKTTLLRAIAGFLAPTTGSIRIDGAVVASTHSLVPPEKRQLGMVFQQHAIWPHWDVARNVGYPLKLAGVRRNERASRVSEVLTMVGLSGFEKRNPVTLSGGQRQRVALARAIVGKPRVLLLDEALSALDEPLRDALRLELQTLTRSVGLTVVHVTHDREEALALADRVVVLDQGRIQQVGTPPELVARPATAAIARFLSDATLLDGELGRNGFVTAGHPRSVSVSRLDVPAGAAGHGQIAVLPEDVDLVANPAGAGTVLSSLYGRAGNDVIVDWQGITMRCRVSGRRPLVGETMDVRISRALFYPTHSTVDVEQLESAR